MTLPRPKAILFDWDNTLVDSWALIHHAMTAVFETLGQRPWTLEEARQKVRKSARDSFPELFGDRADEATEVFYRTYEAAHLEQLRELPGAGAMLRDLAATGSTLLGIVSNKRGEILRLEAAALGWDAYLGPLVGATDAARDKPAREVIDFALKDSGIAAGPEVWYVGDTDIDLLCAHNSKCTPILIRETAPGPEEFAHCPPALHLPDCAAFASTALKALENR